MAEFISEKKTIPYTNEDVYGVLSDFSNLEAAKGIIDENKLENFSFEDDFCMISVNPVGNIKLVIAECQPNSTIKFKAEQLPFAATLHIDLDQLSDNETNLKLSINADLSPFLKPMASKPLQQMVDKLATTLSDLPFKEILNKASIKE